MALCLKDQNVFNTLTLKLWLSGKRKPFLKSWSTVSLLKALTLKMHHFHTILPHQKPMLRQTEWWVPNGPITKNGFLRGTILFYFLILFQFKNLFKRVGLMFQRPRCPYSYFSEALEFYLREVFSLWVFLNKLFYSH